MYEMKSLEDEWKAYKKKKRKPFLSFFFIVSIAIISIVGLEDKKISFDKIKQYIPSFMNLNILTAKVEADKIEESLIRNEALIVLGSNDSKENTNKELNILVDIPILDMENNRVIESRRSEENTLIDIVGTSSVIAYEEVEKRFENNHDIDDALFLAKSYFKKGNYEKSAYWALETNKLDDDVEESIFIFVESKVKSGQVNEGILILKRYIKQSSSEEAKKLLFRIENN